MVKRSVNVDPEAWRIVDGKLYLFFGTGGLEQDWDPHPEAVVAKADAKWPAIEAKLAARERHRLATSLTGASFTDPKPFGLVRV